MFPANCWYVVLDAREVRRRPHGARRLGLDLVFWRDAEGLVRCVLDRCPHRGAALSAGTVADGRIECPFHGFRWDGAGACVKVPCNGPDAQRLRHLATRAFEIREEHGLIWLWWGEPRASLPPVPWFPDLARGYEYSRYTVDTGVNWMRNVENQLDWAHLPFVHGTTIGRGFEPQLEVRSEVSEEGIVTWLTRDEDAQGRPNFAIRFKFPNIWTLPFGRERMSGFVAFVPVDEARSRLYFRTYVRRLPVPGLAGAVGWVSDRLNKAILRQDTRVVATQPAGHTVGIKGEKLVQADLPIAQFRKEVARRSQPDPGLVVIRPPEGEGTDDVQPERCHG